MKDTKLYRFYSTFSVEEAKEWLLFVQSPYFNTNPNVIKMATILRSYHPEMAHKGLAKQKVYKRIFGKEEYQDIKMRKLMSACVKLIERYWVGKSVETDLVLYDSQLKNQYRQRELTAEYEKISHKLISLLESDPEIRNHTTLGAIHLDLYDDQQLIGSKDFIKHLNASSQHNYIAQCTNQIMLSITWGELGRVLNHEPPTYWLEISKYHNKELLSNSIEYSLYHSLKLLLDNRDAITNTVIKDYWNDFTAHANEINSNTRFVITAMILSILRDSSRTNKYDLNLKIETIEWAIKHQGLIYRGQISGSRLYGMCTELCRDHNEELAVRLLESHKSLLPIRYQKQYYKLCKAVILRAKNRFNEAFYLLSSFDLAKYPTYEVRRRSMLLQVAIDFSEINPSIGYSIKQMISRDNKYIRKEKTLSKTPLIYQLKYHNLLLRLYNYLNHITTGIQIGDKILEEVNQNPYIGLETRKWFREKLNKREPS